MALILEDVQDLAIVQPVTDPIPPDSEYIFGFATAALPMGKDYIFRPRHLNVPFVNYYGSAWPESYVQQVPLKLYCLIGAGNKGNPPGVINLLAQLVVIGLSSDTWNLVNVAANVDSWTRWGKFEARVAVDVANETLDNKPYLQYAPNSAQGQDGTVNDVGSLTVEVWRKA